jgi:ketosteroid isomerase-like protein
LTKENPNTSKSKPAEQPEEPVDEKNGQPAGGQEMENFFQRLPGNFRWPKPNAEAVAAAVEAIQRISGSASSAVAQDLAVDGAPESSCSSCGGLLPANARFCVWCGIPAGGDVQAPASGQHHIHHHYHHVAPGVSLPLGVPASPPVSEPEAAGAFVPRGRAPGAPGSTGGRAEAGARQLVQDWAQACNTKHIDDLLELYAADATLIRSSVPPVRSLPAIREFLVALLDAGLGDVEMESLRLEVMGDIAIDLGRCKMLVPIAMGKRREERGKYLIVLVKQPAGGWKILADCWASDLTVAAPGEADPRKASESAPPQRKR